MLSQAEFTTLRVDLLLAGYAPLAPTTMAAELDATIVQHISCDCGAQDMEYRPFSRAGSYRAFAMCRQCAAAVEF